MYIRVSISGYISIDPVYIASLTQRDRNEHDTLNVPSPSCLPSCYTSWLERWEKKQEYFL